MFCLKLYLICIERSWKWNLGRFFNFLINRLLKIILFFLKYVEYFNRENELVF